MMTDISRKNMGKEMAIATQGMEEKTVMVAMKEEEEIPHQGAVTIEVITGMEGIKREVKEDSLKDRLIIELVVTTIAKATRGITENLGVDVVKESHQAEVVSNMKAWSRAHLSKVSAFLRHLHPMKKPRQSAWKK